MKKTNSLNEKIRLFFKIFTPILLAQVTQMIISLIDTIMAGRAGALDLAGVATGSSIWFTIQIGLLGMLSGFTPLVANMIGAQKGRSYIRMQTIQAFYLAFAMSIICALAIFILFPYALNLFDVKPAVKEVAKNYVNYTMIGIIPLFLFTICRNFFDVHGKTIITMLLSIFILPLNTVFNYLFIFGVGGFPKLGGAGTGLGSAISYWAVFITAIIILKKYHFFKKYKLFSFIPKIKLNYWHEVLKIGAPIGVTIFFEVSSFTIVTLLLNKFSINIIAAHQASMNFITLLFMVPISIGSTLTIAIGYEYGAKRLYDAKMYSKIGLISTVIFSVISSLLLFFYRPIIAKLYSNEVAVQLYIIQFLLYGMIFQFSDGIQATLLGVLRGFKDVKPSMYITIIGYWFIGIPSGYILATYTSLGAFGYWIGFTTGLTACAIGLGIRMFYLNKKMAASDQAANNFTTSISN